MGLTNFPNGLTSFGIPVLPGTTSDLYSGNTYFVDSSSSYALDSPKPNYGTFNKPFATIDYAIGQCTANNGDRIYVKEGHTGTISAAGGITCDVAGVTIIGLGVGAQRPTITIDTAATATIVVSAADVKISNMIFTANYADIATCFAVSGKNCVIDKISFYETATNMNFLSCIVTGTTDNGADGLTVMNCERISVDAAALAFISILGNLNRLKVVNNFDNQSSAADVGHFIIMAAKVCLGAQIIGNILNLNGDNSAQTVGVFMTGSSTTSTGVVAYNLVNQLDATTELFDTATLDFGHFQNFMTGTIAKSGYVLPAIDS